MASDEINTELAQLGALARSASGDFENLAFVVRSFARANPLKETFVASLRQARQLLKESGGNVDAVRAALKGAGASGRDLGLIMRQLNGDIDKARRGAMGFESVWQRILSPRTMAYAAHAMQALTGGFSILRGAMSGPLGMAGGAISRGIDMGKGLLDSVVEAAEFRQNALTGMTYMLGGDAEKARALFADAQRLAQATPLDTDKVIGGIKTFLTQGFTADQSKFLYKVVADQASKFLDQPEMEKSVVTAFSRLQGRGYATGEDLESLRVAGFRGADIMRQLQQQPGMESLFTGKKALTGKETETEFFKKVREVLSSGQVGKGTMLNAAIASLYEGQKLEEGPGSLAKKFGKESLTGALSNARNAFGDMLKSMDLVNTKGFRALIGGVDEAGKPFDGFLTKITDGIMGSGKLRETIVGLTDSLLGGFAKITTVDIERFIDTIGKLGQTVIAFIKEAWGWLDKLMHAEPGEFLSSVGDVLVDVGKYLGRGILAGIKSAANPFDNTEATDFVKKYGASEGTMRKMASQAGAGDDQGFKQYLARYEEQQRAFREAGMVRSVERVGGESAGEAYARSVSAFGAARVDAERAASEESYGVEHRGMPVKAFADGGLVTQPTRGLVGEAGPEAVIPLSGAGGGLHISVPIQLVYAGSADPDELSAALEPVAMRVFRNAWERMAMELG